jgi:hypothetical protein
LVQIRDTLLSWADFSRNSGSPNPLPIPSGSALRQGWAGIPSPSPARARLPCRRQPRAMGRAASKPRKAGNPGAARGKGLGQVGEMHSPSLTAGVLGRPGRVPLAPSNHAGVNARLPVRTGPKCSPPRRDSVRTRMGHPLPNPAPPAPARDFPRPAPRPGARSVTQCLGPRTVRACAPPRPAALVRALCQFCMRTRHVPNGGNEPRVPGPCPWRHA